MSAKIATGEVLGECPTCKAAVYGYEASVDIVEMPPNTLLGYRRFRPAIGSEQVTLKPCGDVLTLDEATAWERAVRAA